MKSADTGKILLWIACLAALVSSPTLAEESMKLEVAEVDGYVGPATELSGAWDDKLQNCMTVRTSLEKTTYAKATPEERQQLQILHDKFLTQFAHQKQIEADGCDARLAEVPILSECDFRMPFAAVRTEHLDGTSRALVEKYPAEGAVLFGYKYYNPETAVDDPLFEQRCTAIDGVWQAVSKDSDAYRKAVALYESEAPVTRQDQKSPSLTEIFKPTNRE